MNGTVKRFLAPCSSAVYITFEPDKRFHRNRYFSVSDLSPLLPAFPALRESTERSGDRSLRGRRPRRCAKMCPLTHPPTAGTSIARPPLSVAEKARPQFQTARWRWFRAAGSPEPKGCHPEEEKPTKDLAPGGSKRFWLTRQNQPGAVGILR